MSQRSSQRRNPFSHGKQRKRKVLKKVFEVDQTQSLAELDKGSWFDQEKLERAQKTKQNTSFDKIYGMPHEESHENEESEVESDEVIAPGLALPVHNWIISPTLLQEYLENVAVCKFCHCSLKIWHCYFAPILPQNVKEKKRTLVKTISFLRSCFKS